LLFTNDMQTQQLQGQLYRQHRNIKNVSNKVYKETQIEYIKNITSGDKDHK